MIVKLKLNALYDHLISNVYVKETSFSTLIKFFLDLFLNMLPLSATRSTLKVKLLDLEEI